MSQVPPDTAASEADDSESLVDSLGVRLRELRKASGMSLRDLASTLDISPSAVSQIERGLMQPSVNRLLAMTTALGVPLASVFEPAGQDETATFTAELSSGHRIAREGSIAPLKLEGGVVFRSLSPLPLPGVQLFESTYPAGASGSLHGELLRHDGFEVGEVTEGELSIRFADETVLLRIGDSITFSSSIPHLFTNRSDRPAVATWLIVNR